jgi:hypothetical protein
MLEAVSMMEAASTAEAGWVGSMAEAAWAASMAEAVAVATKH